MPTVSPMPNRTGAPDSVIRFREPECPLTPSLSPDGSCLLPTYRNGYRMPYRAADTAFKPQLWSAVARHRFGYATQRQTRCFDPQAMLPGCSLPKGGRVGLAEGTWDSSMLLCKSMASKAPSSRRTPQGLRPDHRLIGNRQPRGGEGRVRRQRWFGVPASAGFPVRPPEGGSTNSSECKWLFYSGVPLSVASRI